MASFTTTITEQNDSDNRRLYHIDGHSVKFPRLVIQTRKEAANLEASGNSKLQVVFGTSEDGSTPISSKIVMAAEARYPANAQTTDVISALSVLRDFVASDEFTDLVISQKYVQ